MDNEELEDLIRVLKDWLGYQLGDQSEDWWEDGQISSMVATTTAL